MRAVRLTGFNTLRNGNREFPLGPFHGELVADRDLDAFRQRNRFISNSRHNLPFAGLLPQLAQHLSAHALLASGMAGHHSARRGENVDAQPAQNLGNLAAGDVHAAPGRDTRSIREITGTLPGVYLR